jgi:hypothetical protein
MGMGIIAVTPTEDQIREAKRAALTMGALSGSITGGTGNGAGLLGEILIRDMFKFEQVNTKDYDLVTPDSRTVDVKTKHCKTEPRSFYECSVAAHGLTQNCDEYVFVRMLPNLSKAWVLGRIDKSDYFAKAKRHKKGEVDESNGFTFRADCYNLEISELCPLNVHAY